MANLEGNGKYNKSLYFKDVNINKQQTQQILDSSCYYFIFSTTCGIESGLSMTFMFILTPEDEWPKRAWI